jgi:hypothetical protein
MLIVMENDPGGRPALAARRWFAENGPPDLQPLPLGYRERERLKHGGADHILAWYARSLDGANYDVVMHPSFHDYACGVMASDHCPYFIKQNEELQRRFAPRPLEWLTNGMDWEPPTRTRKSCRRSQAQFRLA